MTWPSRRHFPPREPSFYSGAMPKSRSPATKIHDWPTHVGVSPNVRADAVCVRQAEKLCDAMGVDEVPCSHGWHCRESKGHYIAGREPDGAGMALILPKIRASTIPGPVQSPLKAPTWARRPGGSTDLLFLSDLGRTEWARRRTPLDKRAPLNAPNDPFDSPIARHLASTRSSPMPRPPLAAGSRRAGGARRGPLVPGPDPGARRSPPSPRADRRRPFDPSTRR